MAAQRIAIVLLLALFVAARDTSGETSTVNVEVDPRIELLSAVQFMAGYNVLTRESFPYKVEMREHFKPFEGHRAVTLFAEMRVEGFSYDAPVSAVLHHGPPPKLAPLAPYPDDLVRRAGGRERLDAFMDALRDFVEASAFTEFFEAHRLLYERINASITAKLEDVDVAMLEDYYGVKHRGYHIIPAPLFHGGGYGPRVKHEDDRFDVYSVCGPYGVKDDVPFFGTPESFRFLVWHEFSHSFVNPVVDRNGQRVDEYEALMAPIRDAMARQAYPAWRTCVYEHVVRAVTCRFAFREQGDDAGQRALAHEKSRSFIYVEALANRLIEYEKQREKYPTFDAFFPELIAVFDEALEALPEQAAAPPRIVRTIPETGATHVDPNLTELIAEFDRDMDPRNYSWAQRSAETFPQTTGRPFWRTPRICVLPVKLEPGRTYWLGLNVPPFQSFMSTDGTRAEAFTLEFTTASDCGGK